MLVSTLCCSRKIDISCCWLTIIKLKDKELILRNKVNLTVYEYLKNKVKYSYFKHQAKS